MHAFITPITFAATDAQLLISPRNSNPLKKRSPVSVDNTDGAIATSEQRSFYLIKDDFAIAWLQFIYTATRLIQIPFEPVFWTLEQRLSRLEVAILARDQADA